MLSPRQSSKGFKNLSTWADYVLPVLAIAGGCRPHAPSDHAAGSARPLGSVPAAESSAFIPAASPSTQAAPPQNSPRLDAGGAISEPQTQASREIRFVWRPARGSATAYDLPDREDQHRLVLLPGVRKGGAYPVVVGLHGQPKRGTAPRDYLFPAAMLHEAEALVRSSEIAPFVMVLPVFRFEGENWPAFDLHEFRKQVASLLAAEDLSARSYYLFGHSGAAGCGGAGLNQAVRMSPQGVGFFDTCVGPGFGRAIRDLMGARIPALIVHSVETAGFVPRQQPEYRTDFDFGAVYGPLGLTPVACSSDHRPDAPPRKQPFACAEDASRLVRAFVVDTGEGKEAHERAASVGIRYFLRTMLRDPR